MQEIQQHLITWVLYVARLLLDSLLQKLFTLLCTSLLSVALLGILSSLLSPFHPPPCISLPPFLALFAAYHRHPHQPGHQRPAPLLCYHCQIGRAHV